LDSGREETVEWRKLGLKPIIPSSYRSRRNVNRRIRVIRGMPGIATRCPASGVSGSHDMNPSSARSLGRTEADPLYARSVRNFASGPEPVRSRFHLDPLGACGSCRRCSRRRSSKSGPAAWLASASAMVKSRRYVSIQTSDL
jgi:hypothetical protein